MQVDLLIRECQRPQIYSLEGMIIWYLLRDAYVPDISRSHMDIDELAVIGCFVGQYCSYPTTHCNPKFAAPDAPEGLYLGVKHMAWEGSH